MMSADAHRAARFWDDQGSEETAYPFRLVVQAKAVGFQVGDG